MVSNIAIFGSTGAIGKALIKQCKVNYPGAMIHCFSRNHIATEADIANSAHQTQAYGSLDLIIVATGVLHTHHILPEKSLDHISAEKFTALFSTNTILPALIAKYFIPKLNHNSVSVFAALSARVGSISDNQLGGWYAYRVSKAALNMFIKTAAIEAKRKNNNAIIVGLHPGTVDSKLSQPFQKNIPDKKIFTPEFSAEQLLTVINQLDPKDTGKCFAWDGKEILP